MKKRVIFSILFLLILSNIFLVLAQDIPALPGLSGELNPETGLPEGASETIDKFSDKESRENYLKEEWTKILEKSGFGRFLLWISGIFKGLSPIFKLLIGIEYSLSWFFFLGLFFWISAVIIIYKAIKLMFEDKIWTPLGITLVITTIAAQFGMNEYMINFFLPLLSGKWIIAIVIMIGVMLLVGYSQLMKTVGKDWAEKLKEAREKRREAKAKTVEEVHDIEITAAGGS